MIAFYLFAALLLFLALGVLLRSLTLQSHTDDTNHRDVNIGIARDRKSLIKDALSKGHLDQETYDQELQDIENTLATELVKGPNSKQSRGMRVAGVMLLFVLLPATSVALYQRLGSPNSMDPLFLEQVGAITLSNGATVNQQYADFLKNSNLPAGTTTNGTNVADAQSETGPASLQDLLPQLEAKLKENPDDVQGWTLLGRTYMNTGDFVKAEEALTRVVELDASNPDALIMLAESKALQIEGNLSGEPQALIQQALKLNPEHNRAQLLLGLSLQQQSNHEQAIEIFRKLRANPNASETVVSSLTQMINQSQAAIGGNSANPQSSNETTEVSGTSLSVSVSLSEAASTAVNASDSVFIFARASEGPPMPLAVVRLTVADLPTTVTLDDTQAMLPNMTLSSFPSVTVGARVSASGDAIGQSGDWFGELTDLLTTDNPSVEIIIDRQKP